MALVDDSGTAVISASRYPHGYATVRSLGRQGVRTIAAVDDMDLPVAASTYCDEVVSVPPSYDLSPYKEALLDLAARPDVQTIIPHRPQDPYLLAKYYDEFDRHIDVVVPSLETLEIVHDRKQLAEAAAEAGVAMPETDLLTEVEDWDSSGDRIVKARYNLLTDAYVDGFKPGESKIAKPVEHVPAGETPDIDALVEEMKHVPIVQEYVDGADEYVFGALYDHGEALATFQHRQLRGDSYTGSGGVYRQSIDVPALEETGLAILDAIDWHGLACIEFIKDAKTGEFTIVEINPRMWQSLACATRADANFPYWYWLQATGRPSRIASEHEIGVCTHYLYGELEHLVSVVRETSPLVDRPSFSRRVGEIAASCLMDPQFDTFHLDDPGPVLRLARTELKSVVTRRVGTQSLWGGIEQKLKSIAALRSNGLRGDSP